MAAPGTVAAWRNLADVEAVVLHFWIEERLPARGLRPGHAPRRTGRKTLMALVDEAGDAYPRYCVENVVEALSPGEWYLDRPSGRLHYAPAARGAAGDDAGRGPRADASLLRIEGEPEKERFVEGLRFEGISFEHAAVPASEPAVQAAWTTPGTLVLRGARNVAIEDGRLAGLGGYAVEIGAGCRGRARRRQRDPGRRRRRSEGGRCRRRGRPAPADDGGRRHRQPRPRDRPGLPERDRRPRPPRERRRDRPQPHPRHVLHGDLRRLGVGLRAERHERHPRREEPHPRHRPGRAVRHGRRLHARASSREHHPRQPDPRREGGRVRRLGDLPRRGQLAPRDRGQRGLRHDRPRLPPALREREHGAQQRLRVRRRGRPRPLARPRARRGPRERSPSPSSGTSSSATASR